MPACCVPNCINSEKTKPLRNFHRFPRDSHRVQIWLNCLNINKKVTANLRVCSDHFLQSDFFIHTKDGKMMKRLMKSAKPVYISANKEADVNKSQLICSSIEMKPVVIESRPIGSSLQNMPLVIQYQPIYSSLQTMTVVSESEPTYSSLLMMCTKKEIETDHNYATDVRSLKQKYEESIIYLKKKTNAIKCIKNKWARSVIKVSKLVKELKDTKKRCDEAYRLLKAYEEIPRKSLKKVTKESTRAKKDVLIKLTLMLNKRSEIIINHHAQKKVKDV